MVEKLEVEPESISKIRGVLYLLNNGKIDSTKAEQLITKIVTPSIGDRTDWESLRQEVYERLEVLKKQPESEKVWSRGGQCGSFAAILNAFALAEITVEQAATCLARICDSWPEPLIQRDDWKTIELETYRRIQTLRQRPDKLNGLDESLTVASMLSAFVAGHLDADDVAKLFNKKAGLPIEKQNSVHRLRRMLFAVLARLQKICGNRYEEASYDSYFGTSDAVDWLLRGTLTREQAIAILDRLVEKGVLRD